METSPSNSNLEENSQPCDDDLIAIAAYILITYTIPPEGEGAYA